MWTQIVGAVGDVLGTVFQGGYHGSAPKQDYSATINKMQKTTMIIIGVFALLAIIIMIVISRKK